MIGRKSNFVSVMLSYMSLVIHDTCEGCSSWLVCLAFKPQITLSSFGFEIPQSEAFSRNVDHFIDDIDWTWNQCSKVVHNSKQYVTNHILRLIFKRILLWFNLEKNAIHQSPPGTKHKYSSFISDFVDYCVAHLLLDTIQCSYQYWCCHS